MLVYVCVCIKRNTRRSHVFSATHFSFTSDISPAFILLKILLRTKCAFAPHRSSGISFNYVVSTIHIQYVSIFFVSLRFWTFVTILDLVSRVPFKLNGSAGVRKIEHTFTSYHEKYTEIVETLEPRTKYANVFLFRRMICYLIGI